jgi:hypothetical protein
MRKEVSLALVTTLFESGGFYTCLFQITPKEKEFENKYKIKQFEIVPNKTGDMSILSFLICL